MDSLFSVQNAIALITLTVLEIVLGVDNVIFLAIVTQDVPPERQNFVRRLGLSLALLGRIVMVLGVTWLLGLEEPIFTLLGHAFSAKDLILIGGGLFLVYKAVTEIYKTTELKEDEEGPKKTFTATSMGAVVLQIMVVDMIFAIDSVLTAVGLTSETWLIIIAMTIAILCMMFFATPIADFIHRHPSVKILALAFLVLVGVLLLADGFGHEIDRTYVYFSILFALGIEALNFRRQANLAKHASVEGSGGL